jgi:hypothetical protein
MGLNWMLAGSRGGLRGVTEEEFGRQWRDPAVAPSLRAEGLESPEILGTTFLGDAPYLQELARGAAPVVDDRPHRISAAPADEAANLPFYRAIADTTATRKRFETSDSVRRSWPASLRARSLEAFEHQRILNGYLLTTGGGTLANRLDALHAALTRTSSRALPVWFMDSQETETAIAARAAQAGETGSMVEYLLAVDAIARRDFTQGARRLSIVKARNPSSARIAGLHALALHMAGDGSGARAAAAAACEARPARVLDAETCAWFGRTFPGAAASPASGGP